jgi:hypothetical protein
VLDGGRLAADLPVQMLVSRRSTVDAAWRLTWTKCSLMADIAALPDLEGCDAAGKGAARLLELRRLRKSAGSSASTTTVLTNTVVGRAATAPVLRVKRPGKVALTTDGTASATSTRMPAG